jgi:hypothetical protein
MIFQKVLEEALKDVETNPADEVTILLAKRLCFQLDMEPDKITVYGPKLMTVLDSLGMTPKSRAAIIKGEGGDSTNTTGDSPLDKLRAKRAERISNQESQPESPEPREDTREHPAEIMDSTFTGVDLGNLLGL